jgi:putative ABC transport system permease protein
MLKDLALEALRALTGHRLRSALTMLGVVIGVASVILMLGIGEGSRMRVAESISSLGTHQLIVLSGGGSSGGLRGPSGTLPTLTVDDAHALRELPSIKAVAPVSQSSVRVISALGNRSASLVGSSTDYLSINRWALQEGRNFTATEARASATVALIGDTLRKELFPDGSSPVGQSLRVQRQVVEVIGVLAAKGQGVGGQSFDDTLLMPLSTAQRRLAGTPFPGTVATLQVEAVTTDRKAEAEQELRGLLRQRHRLAQGVEDDFSVRDLASLSASLAVVTQVMSLLLGSIALISLLVGGIGVMNIMLVSVSERTREIGLRLAVGATPSAIQWQFLMEALALTGLGAVLGLSIGLGGGLLITASGALTVIFSAQSIGLSVLVATGVGLLFGWWPARRAAQLVPADALRS